MARDAQYPTMHGTALTTKNDQVQSAISAEIEHNPHYTWYWSFPPPPPHPHTSNAIGVMLPSKEVGLVNGRDFVLLRGLCKLGARAKVFRSIKEHVSTS